MLLARTSDWTTTAELGDLIDTSTYSAAQITAAIEAASDWLFEKHRRWPGSTAETIRPCTRTHAAGCSWHWSAGSDIRCRCTGAHILELPNGPVTSIGAVVVAGETLSEGTDWRLVQPNWLVRIGPGNVWPDCNDPALAPGAADDDAWYITYTFGAEPPALGRIAATALAAELLKAQKDTSDCVLPPHTVTATGLGITLQLDANVVARSIFAVGAFFDAYPIRTLPTIGIPGHGLTFTDTP